MTSDSLVTAKPPTNHQIASTLEDLSGGDAQYWSFADRGDRKFVHSLFQYPAMMVPRLQGKLIESFVKLDPRIAQVYDPFVGSGTVMTEAMLQGLEFFGSDINPLAVLVAQAKAELFDSDLLESELQRVIKRSISGKQPKPEVQFPNLDKWFEPHVVKGLSMLRASIKGCDQDAVRRFWWVALAETVRLSSNSRTSTVKLHIRPASEIATRPDPVPLFAEIAWRNLRVLRQQQEFLESRLLLDGARYARRIRLRIGDVRTVTWNQTAALMMTSPPYGDNHTTVTYGQASYLPLQWIDRNDIKGLDSDDCIENTHRLDSLSLGGSSARRDKLESLLDRSPNLRYAFDKLSDAPPDRQRRLIAFYADLDDSLGPIVDRVRPGGLLVWTTGARRIGGLKITMASILEELLGSRTEPVSRLSRIIPSGRKRMPLRNATVETMNDETILVMRRTKESK